MYLVCEEKQMSLETVLLNLNISPEVESSKSAPEKVQGIPQKRKPDPLPVPPMAFSFFLLLTFGGGGCHMLVKVGDSDSGCILKPTYRDPRYSVAGALLTKRVRRPLV